ncbi:hypothetical protein [Flavobacterium sp. TSSA_36]|uniref:hypothetical protein n=1 Tax=Flavobacterium sp. TSSA_36 TaxID=3447669 RepID=UPI003F40FDB5
MSDENKTIEILFFEYKKNCPEFNVLIKATSANASRKDLIEGQLLFQQIKESISGITMKLYDIDQMVLNKTISRRNKNIKIEYYTSTVPNNINYYYDPADIFIDLVLDKISKFLDVEFDHHKYTKDSNSYKNGTLNTNIFTKHKTRECSMFYEDSIEKSIECVLEYYFKISSRLMLYFDILSENKNDRV